MSTASAMFSASARAKGMTMGVGGPTSRIPGRNFAKQEAFNYINPGHGMRGKQHFQYGAFWGDLGGAVAESGRKFMRGIEASKSMPGMKAFNFPSFGAGYRAGQVINAGQSLVSGARQGAQSAINSVRSGARSFGSSIGSGVRTVGRDMAGAFNPRPVLAEMGRGVNGVYNRSKELINRMGKSISRMENPVSNFASGWNMAGKDPNFFSYPGANSRMFQAGYKVKNAANALSDKFDRGLNRAIDSIANPISNFSQGFSTGVRNRGGTGILPPISNKAFVSGYKLGSFGAHKIRPKPINVSTNSSRGFTATPQTPTGPKGSLGVSEFFDTVGSSWSNLSRTQQWAMGGGAAVAGLVALNVGYNSIKNSKQSPFGSAVAGGLLVGGGAMGLRYGGRTLAKWGGQSAEGASMRAIGAGMEKMGPKSWKGAAKLGAYTAGGVAALGVGRSVIGQ